MYTLYVGADDSNHAGDSKGEIIVTTFSTIREDGIVRDFPNNRNCSELQNWIKHPQRDFRFTVLTTEKYRHSHQNLVSIVPKLVNQYILENSLGIDKLALYLDGRLERGSRNFIRNQFPGIEKVVVDNFIKKNKDSRGIERKRPHCPAVVYFADVMANHLYSNKTFEELTNHEKMYNIY